MKKTLALLLALVMLVGVLAGCNNTPEQTKPNSQDGTEKATNQPVSTPPADTKDAAPETTEAVIPESETPMKLQWMQGIGIDTLFEAPAHDMQSLYPQMVFDPLMFLDSLNARFVPGIATDWSHNEDYTEFSITIREDAKWHDGEPLTVDDVVFSIINDIANPNSTRARKYMYVEGFEALQNGETDTLSGMTVNGNVITFKLSQKQVLFLEEIYATYVIPKHLLGDIPFADADSSDFWKKPIGSGPYKVDEVKFPDYCTLVRNDEYWGEPAGIKNVQLVSYQAGGNDAAVAAVINGDIDFAMRQLITDQAVADNIVSQNKDVKPISMAAYNIRCFVPNLGPRADHNEKADLQKKEVRQAFDLLIDQEAIASFYNGQAVASATLVNPVGTEYNTDIPNVAKDVSEAKKLLDEAGFDYSQTIDMAYYYNDQTTLDIMALITQDFAEAGVTLNTFLLEGDLAKLIYEDCNYDIIYLAGAAKASDQSAYYFQCTSWNTYSFMGQAEERAELFDDLMNAYNGTSDAEERKELSWKLQALNYEYAYMIPAYILNNIVAYNTAHIQIPEECFEASGGNYYKWESWKMLH